MASPALVIHRAATTGAMVTSVTGADGGVID